MSRHQEHIVAVNSSVLSKLGIVAENNLCVTDIFPVLPSLTSEVVIAQRLGLETDVTKRQLLPYVVFTMQTPEGVKLFFYRRGKGVGESRLAGNVSCGIGGHVDAKDAVWDDKSVLDLVSTIVGSTNREISEELHFELVEENDIHVRGFGFLIDDTDEVGRVHLGLVLRAEVPVGTLMHCAEEELETIGFKTPKEILESGLPLEGWTRSLVEHFAEIE